MKYFLIYDETTGKLRGGTISNYVAEKARTGGADVREVTEQEYKTALITLMN